MQDEFCEVRLDVPLEDGADAHAFERSWRAALAAQRLNGTTRPVAARFRLCCADLDTARAAAWSQYLTARMAALPGGPPVVAETATPTPDWQGVHVWLHYRPRDLAALLKRHRSKPTRARGRRP